MGVKSKEFFRPSTLYLPMGTLSNKTLTYFPGKWIGGKHMVSITNHSVLSLLDSIKYKRVKDLTN